MKAHTQVGHENVKKALGWLKPHCYLEGMNDTVQQVLDSCRVCRSHTGPNLRSKHDIPAPYKPLNSMRINLI